LKFQEDSIFSPFHFSFPLACFDAKHQQVANNKLEVILHILCSSTNLVQKAWTHRVWSQIGFFGGVGGFDMRHRLSVRGNAPN